MHIQINYSRESFESLDSSSKDNSIKIWDIYQLICIYNLVNHTDKVNHFFNLIIIILN